MTPRFAIVISSSLLTIVGVTGGMSVIARQRVQAGQAATSASSGTTATRLADGHWLFLGGEGSTGVPSSAATLWDPSTQTTVSLPGRMLEARAGHTATLLPDGRVLIVGGRGASDEIVPLAERFDPATETFESLPMPGATPRVDHTATLLTDGRVLIAGGRTDAPPPPVAGEVWNLESATVGAVAGTAPTGKFAASLLSDGRVALVGGVDASGRPAGGLVVFDPRTNVLHPLTAAPPDDGGALLVSEANPPAGATDVPIDMMVTLRLSHAARPDSVNDRTVVLSGPTGAVAARVVPAETGRLLFVRPLDPLASGSGYELTIAGAIDAAGVPLSMPALRFTTVKSSPLPEVDLESWRPDPAGVDDWRTHRPPSPWQSLPALHAEPGVTALAGQALTLDGRPLPHVTLAIEGDHAETDSTGRFLLRTPTASEGHHELRIDGRTASRPNKAYGLFEYGLTLSAGTTTVLPFAIWMPRLDLANQVVIPSPTVAETTITTPFIPGLELHLPPRTVIRDEDGKVATTIGITPIPVDRPPFPLAKNVEVPVYFTIQPGGAYVHTGGTGAKGAWLVYPNYSRQYAGKRTQFFHYDPEDRGWYVYGLGTVTANAAQVVPDSTTRIYEFTGAMLNSGSSPPNSAPPPGDCKQAGDPVDLATGLLIVENTDLELPDVLPLSLTRTYRPGDPAVRPFGIGTNHAYGIFLWSALQYQQADLILPDGGRVHYVRVSSGTGWTDAVFEAATTPTAFYKSVIRWNGFGWDLTLKDGTVYVFGENAPLQAIRDRYGNRITITRTSGQTGNITRVTSPNGRWMAFSYDSSNRITQASDNGGRIVAYTYDASGRLWKVTDPNGGVTTYTYDTSHRMLSITNARSVTFVTNQYDANGRVTQQTHADGGIYRFAYTLDGNGRVTQVDVTDPRGTVRRTAFNAAGYCASDTLAVGLPEAQTTTWTRDVTSNLVQTATDALNRQTAYTYDSWGNRLTTTRLAGTPEAVTTSTTYESVFNQITGATDPLGHTLSLTYDGKGSVTAATDGLQHRSTFVSRADGRLSAAIDPLGNTTTYAYTGGDLTTITDPLARSTTRFFDAIGRMVTRTDPRTSVYRYRYDSMSRLIGFTSPMNIDTTPSYDANGNLALLIDPRSSATSHTYTNMDLLATRTDPLNRTEHYEYDLLGNVARATDRKGQVSTFSYDALNRLTFAGSGQAGGSYENTTTYGYDAANRLTRVVDSTTGTNTFAYDGLDRLISETTPRGTVSYAYDADGRRTNLTVAGQTTISYSYDAAERVTAITRGSEVIGFTYDDANRRTSLALPNGILVTYEYDAASQLVRIGYRSGGTLLGDLTYTYDAIGNRVSVGGSWARVSLPRALTAALYDAANQLTEWGGQTFSYDGNGNLVGDGTNLFLWNARNQLTGTTGAGGSSFSYDGLGRRSNKTVAGVTTSYVYDAVNIAQELTGTTPTATLVNGLGVDERFTRTDATGTFTYLADGLSNNVAIADGAGALSTEYSFEPFGAATSAGLSSTNRFQFSGRENDETGLLYFRARYYDPRTARFISEDPLGLRGGIDLYRYVDDNPVNLIDPFGLETYMCTEPLQSLSKWPSWPSWLLGGSSRSGPDVFGNPFYHQFICVFEAGVLTCNGHTRSGGPWSKGTASNDDATNPRAVCQKVAPDSDCIETCIKKAFVAPRPFYGIGPGMTDCQEWAAETLGNCLKRCK